MSKEIVQIRGQFTELDDKWEKIKEHNGELLKFQIPKSDKPDRKFYQMYVYPAKPEYKYFFNGKGPFRSKHVSDNTYMIKLRQKQFERIVSKTIKNAVSEAIEKYKKVYSTDEINVAWQRFARNNNATNMEVLFFDSKYVALPENIWKMVLRKSDVSDNIYISESRDCDDYSFALKGCVSMQYAVNGVAMVIDYSGGHAYCMLIVDDNGKPKLQVVEPQSDMFVSVDQSKMYSMDKGMIIF